MLFDFRDKNLLASSQARPSQYRYLAQTEDVFKLTALLIESLIKNHHFANANKRTGMLSGYLFLLLNGQKLIAPQDQIIEMGVGISLGKYDLFDIDSGLFHHLIEFDSRLICVKNDNPIEINKLI